MAQIVDGATFPGFALYRRAVAERDGRRIRGALEMFGEDIVQAPFAVPNSFFRFVSQAIGQLAFGANWPDGANVPEHRANDGRAR